MVPCPDCGKMFKDRYLKLHQRKVHSAAACEICGVVVKNVKHHMQGVHMADSDKRFHCKDCGKGFMCRVTMNNHRMNMHIKAQPYQCRYGCDNRYNDTSNRSAHERRRHGAVWTADHAKLQKFVWLEIIQWSMAYNWNPQDICLTFHCHWICHSKWLIGGFLKYTHLPWELQVQVQYKCRSQIADGGGTTTHLLIVRLPGLQRALLRNRSGQGSDLATTKALRCLCTWHPQIPMWGYLRSSSCLQIWYFDPWRSDNLIQCRESLQISSAKRVSTLAWNSAWMVT